MNDAEIFARVMQRFCQDDSNWSEVVGNSTIILDGSVDVTEDEMLAYVRIVNGSK